jgi:hypothetical protein
MGDVFRLDDEEAQGFVDETPPHVEQSTEESGYTGAFAASLLDSPVGKLVTRGAATAHARGFIFNPVTGMPVQIEEISNQGFSLADSLNEAIENGEIGEEDRKYFNDVEDIYGFRETLELVRAENWTRGTKENASTLENLGAGFISIALDPLSSAVSAATGGIGGTVARMAVGGATYGGVSAAASYALSKTVPAEEIIDYTLGGAIFGTLLGGAASSVTRKTLSKWGKGLGEYIRDSAPYKVLEVKGEELSLRYLTPVGEFVREKIGEPFVNFINSSPYLQVLRIEDEKLRSIGLSLFRNNQIITDKMREGKTYGLSAEGQMNIRLNEQAFLERNYNDILTKAVKEEKINPREFNLRVSRYLRGEEEEASPLVKAAGDKIVAFEKEILKEAVEYGVIPTDYAGVEGVKAMRARSGIGAKIEAPVLTKEEAAMSMEEFIGSKDSWSDSPITARKHLARMYDKEAIYANKSEFDNLLLRAQLKKHPYSSDGKLRKLANDQYDYIMGTNFSERYVSEGLEFDAISGIKFIKDRTVNIADNALEKFLVNNPIEVLNNGSIRKVMAATQLNRVAREHGYRNWENLIKKVEKSFSSIGIEGEAAKKLDAEKLRIPSLFCDAADLLAGNFAHRWDNPKLAKWFKNLRWLNRVTQLGGVFISSIIDIGIVISRQGLAKTARRTLDELFSKKNIFDRQAMEKVMVATEIMQNSGRLLDETFTRGGAHSLGEIEKSFHRATMLPRWNDFWKRVTATLHYDSILEAALRNNEADQLFLRQNRISGKMKDILVKEFKSAGYKEEGLHFLPLDRIEDKSLMNTLTEALQTAANETVITPGAGDVPRILRGSIGSTLLQYKSFITAFHTNVFVPLLRQAESRKYLGQYIASSLALSTVTTDLKERIAGRKPDYSSLDFWKRVLFRSNLLSFLPDVYEVGEGIIRFGDISKISAPIQTVDKMIQMAKFPSKKNMITEYEMRKAIGLIPFNNLFYLKAFLVDPLIRKEALNSGRKLVKNYNFLGME